MRIFLILLITIYLNAYSNNTKKELKNTTYTIKKMNLKLDLLAKNIIKTQKKIKNLNTQIASLNKTITVLKNYLKNSNKKLTELNDLKRGFLKREEDINREIEAFIAQNYYLDNKKIETINDLIYTTLNEEILKEYSKEVQKLIKEKQSTEKNIQEINKKIKDILTHQKELEKQKKELLKLKQKQIKLLRNLKKQKEIYKETLENMLKKQKRLQQKLAELKIIKKQKEIITNIPENINVKKIGNAYIRPKTTRYRGRKTIPPVKGKIVKKFGFYIDPIYKIKIYNDSITIKTKKNALVRAILPGKVIYIQKEGDKKIIFIKHKNNLFSIYSNLSKISPLIKKGSFVKKGQIIARVKNYLEFEVTYKDKPINPLQVINLK